MYEVNKTNKNMLYFAFNVSLVAVNDQVSLFIEIKAHFIVVSLCVAFDCSRINPLNAKLNPTCHLLALLRAHPIFHVSRIRVNKF